MAFLTVLLYVCTALVLCTADNRPSVTTKLGVINGSRYAGIRYAKVPVGELRFEKPEPFGNFPAPLDASEFTSPCPQNDAMKLGVESMDEDCLSLNVFVPSDSPSGHAVMVFIHGGGFSMGGSNTVPIEVLSAFGNVIAVTINYRLGLLGFANTGDGKIAGNMGLWDQRLALQWVKDNIDSFGGDSSRITIFGESAGSASVTMHGMYPPNKGLFQNIIAESGTPAMPYGIAASNLPSLMLVAESLECSSENTEAIIECLKQADIVTIMAKLGELLKDPANMMKIQLLPTIDGDFIKRPQIETIQEAKFTPNEEVNFLRSLRLINGMNSAEGAMWLMMAGAQDPEHMIVSHDDMKVMHITGSNSWLYSFDALIDVHLLPHPSWVKGANLGDELAPVFGYCMRGVDGMYNLKTDYTPPQWELDMSARMMTYWTNFAKFGDPNGLKVDIASWPALNMDSRQFIRFNREDTIDQNLYAEEVNFWREIVPLVRDVVEHAHSKDSPFSSKSSESCDDEGNCE